MGAWLSWLAATPPLPHRLEPEAGVAQCNYEARPPPRAAHVRSPSAHLPPRRGSCCARSTAGWTRRACSTRSARARCSARCATRHRVCSSGSMMSTSTSSLARPACCCGSSRPAVPRLPCRALPCPAALCPACTAAPRPLPCPAPLCPLPRHAAHLERCAERSSQPAHAAQRGMPSLARGLARTSPSPAVRTAGGLRACRLAQPVLLHAAPRGPRRPRGAAVLRLRLQDLPPVRGYGLGLGSGSGLDLPPARGADGAP